MCVCVCVCVCAFLLFFCFVFFFLVFAQNKDCGVNEAVLPRAHDPCFKAVGLIKKTNLSNPVYPTFTIYDEPRSEKIGFSHMQKQRSRSATR